MKRPNSSKILCILALVATVITAPAHALDAGSKLCRGLAGLGLGFLELPGNMIETSKEEGIALGLSEGFLKGVCMMPVRYAVSIYEVLTFPFDAPKEYRSPLTPEYPWGYMTGADTKAPPAETPQAPAVVTPPKKK